ncbi:MAG: hypothetical protein ACYDHH_31830 [Solirubrobacteraceae bacterium]
MIVAPTTAQAIRAVARDLQEVIAPVLIDPGLQKMVGMAAVVLAMAATRAELEAELMREEIAAIQTALEDRTAPAATALAAVRDHADEPGNLHRRYELAGEALACAGEAALAAGDPEADRVVRELLQARLVNAGRLLGAEFALVARA